MDLLCICRIDDWRMRFTSERIKSLEFASQSPKQEAFIREWFIIKGGESRRRLNTNFGESGHSRPSLPKRFPSSKRLIRWKASHCRWTSTSISEPEYRSRKQANLCLSPSLEISFSCKSCCGSLTSWNAARAVFWQNGRRKPCFQVSLHFYTKKKIKTNCVKVRTAIGNRASQYTSQPFIPRT